MSDIEENVGGEATREPVRVHVPVLPREVVDAMTLSPGMAVVDGTVGAGGHASLIVERIAPNGLLMGLDQDAEILARAEATSERLADVAAGRVRVRFFHLRFSEMRSALAQVGLPACDAVLLDLGVSSLHLDRPERGFSFMHDGPLDMRMDQSRGPTAAEWLQQVSERELARVLFEYGEERYSRRIARAICDARRGLTTTAHLASIVRDAIPGGRRPQRIDAATRSFQAIRIAVNGELDELRAGLAAANDALRPGGRLAVISFHSLEDRIVKHFLREQMDLPFRKPIVAGPDEVAANPRSRSAKLRCGIKRAA